MSGMQISTIELSGCSPQPLAYYLKALAVLRLVSEQVDVKARGQWIGDAFVLHTKLTRDSLLQFFLNTYAPTPIIGPWNGGSGFHPKDNKSALDAIIQGSAARYGDYRVAIHTVVQLLENLGIDEKASGDTKQTLLTACRSVLPDRSVQWLDAAFILTSEGAKYPPLLGTGGNDGRLDFTNNFMQRLCDLFSPMTGEPSVDAARWLQNSLFGTEIDGLQRNNAIGQFHPSAAGGNNQASGFDGPTVMNPWDYVLMMEGALMFAGAAVRKLESSAPGVLSYPFSVRSSGAGYGTATLSDESSSRSELWLPLWSSSASADELSALMSEGRAQVANRAVRNGVDFARAIATLGVDRGIDRFERYGFQVRNGLAYFATPLGRFDVQLQPAATLLDPIDRWLDRFIGRAKSDKAPGSITRAARTLESAILTLTRYGGQRELQAVLVALGACEAAMSVSFKWTTDPMSALRPIHGLSAEWLAGCDDGSVEYRLAASLASLRTRYSIEGRQSTIPLRAHMTPIESWEVNRRQHAQWTKTSHHVVWSGSALTDNLAAVLTRRVLMGMQSSHSHYIDRSTIPASLSDVAAFVEGRTDDARLAELVRGLALLDWPAIDGMRTHSSDDLTPDATYAALKLCFAGRKIGDIEVPLTPAIIKNAYAGNAYAMQLALRRLRASGVTTAFRNAWLPRNKFRRTVAALLFPLTINQIETLHRSIARLDNFISA